MPSPSTILVVRSIRASQLKLTHPVPDHSAPYGCKSQHDETQTGVPLPVFHTPRADCLESFQGTTKG